MPKIPLSGYVPLSGAKLYYHVPDGFEPAEHVELAAYKLAKKLGIKTNHKDGDKLVEGVAARLGVDIDFAREIIWSGLEVDEHILVPSCGLEARRRESSGDADLRQPYYVCAIPFVGQQVLLGRRARPLQKSYKPVGKRDENYPYARKQSRYDGTFFSFGVGYATAFADGQPITLEQALRAELLQELGAGPGDIESAIPLTLHLDDEWAHGIQATYAVKTRFPDVAAAAASWQNAPDGWEYDKMAAVPIQALLRLKGDVAQAASALYESVDRLAELVEGPFAGIPDNGLLGLIMDEPLNFLEQNQELMLADSISH